MKTMKPNLIKRIAALAVLAAASAFAAPRSTPLDVPAAVPGWDIEDKARWSMLNQEVTRLCETGDDDRAARVARQAVELAETKVGPGHPDVAASLDQLASIHANQGDFDKAAPLYQRSLAIMEKSLGPDHPGLSAYVYRLAQAYQSQGKDVQAERFFRRSHSLIRYEVRVKVLDGHGAPSAGTMVYAVGLERATLMPLAEAMDAPEWRWQTDAQGTFVAQFDGGRLPGTRQGPSVGTYHFIVLAGADHCGAISPRLEIPEDGNQPTVAGRSEDRGKDPGSMSMVLWLQKGITVNGDVVDQAGRPVTGHTVRLWHDLHALSHTGYGGQVFEKSAVTDATGHFRFERVYPADFEISPGLVWLRGRLQPDAPWDKDPCDEVKFTDGSDPPYVGMEVTTEKQFRIHGVVRDANGHPITGAEVGAAVSHHQQARTWGDTHHFFHQTTGPDGRYEIMADSPWIRAVEAKKEGYRSSVHGSYDEAPMIPPGEYNFTLPEGTDPS